MNRDGSTWVLLHALLFGGRCLLHSSCVCCAHVFRTCATNRLRMTSGVTRPPALRIISAGHTRSNKRSRCADGLLGFWVCQLSHSRDWRTYVTNVVEAKHF